MEAGRGARGIIVGVDEHRPKMQQGDVSNGVGENDFEVNRGTSGRRIWEMRLVIRITRTIGKAIRDNWYTVSNATKSIVQAS